MKNALITRRRNHPIKTQNALNQYLPENIRLINKT